MFIVTTNVTGPTYYLRSRIWTSEIDRATRYETEEAAKAAIEKSKQFNPKPARAAKIVVAPD